MMTFSKIRIEYAPGTEPNTVKGRALIDGAWLESADYPSEPEALQDLMNVIKNHVETPSVLTPEDMADLREFYAHPWAYVGDIRICRECCEVQKVNREEGRYYPMPHPSGYPTY